MSGVLSDPLRSGDPLANLSRSKTVDDRNKMEEVARATAAPWAAMFPAERWRSKGTADITETAGGPQSKGFWSFLDMFGPCSFFQVIELGGLRNLIYIHRFHLASLGWMGGEALLPLQQKVQSLLATLVLGDVRDDCANTWNLELCLILG